LTSSDFATANSLRVYFNGLVGLLFVERLHIEVKASLGELGKAASIVWDFEGFGKGRTFVLLPIVALTADWVVVLLHYVDSLVILSTCSALVGDISYFSAAVSHLVDLCCALVSLVEKASAVDSVALLDVFEKRGVVLIVFLTYLMVRVFHGDVVVAS
jgi:hypothetical protein